MAKKSKAIVKSSTALTGSVSKARKELVLRGLTALSKDSEEKLSKRRVIILRLLSSSPLSLLKAVSPLRAFETDPVRAVELFTIALIFLAISVSYFSD